MSKGARNDSNNNLRLLLYKPIYNIPMTLATARLQTQVFEQRYLLSATEMPLSNTNTAL